MSGGASASALLAAGLLPVLHGDCVLDTALGCTVLSGGEAAHEHGGGRQHGPKPALLGFDLLRCGLVGYGRLRPVIFWCDA